MTAEDNHEPSVVCDCKSNRIVVAEKADCHEIVQET